MKRQRGHVQFGWVVDGYCPRSIERSIVALRADRRTIATGGNSLAFIARAEKPHIDAARLKPSEAKYLQHRRNHVTIDSDARHQTATKPKGRCKPVVVNLVLRVGSRIVGPDTK